MSILGYLPQAFPAILIGAFMVGAVVLPRWLIWMAIFLGCSALPATPLLPGLYQFGSLQVPPYEPFLVGAAIYCAARYHHRGVGRFVLIFAGVGLFAWIVGTGGLAGGTPRFVNPQRNLFETKMWVDWILGFYVAGCVAMSPLATTALRVVRISLWWSAVATVLAAAGAIRLTGAEETVGILGHYTSAARLQTAANFPALAVACACIGAVLVGRVTLRSTIWYLVPATLILFLSFSRNNLLGLGVAVLLALVASWSTKTALEVVGRIVLVLGLATLFSFAAQPLRATAPGDLVASQLEAYSFRVISGLSRETLAIDPSTQARFVENDRMIDAILEAPLVGHGFGFRYQNPRGPAGSFTSSIGPYYGHNYYLWLWMKVGALAIVVFGLWVFLLVRGVRFADTPQVMAVCASGGLMAVCVFAPVPNDTSSVLSIAGSLGVLAGMVLRPGWREPSAEEPLAQPVPPIEADSRVADR